MNLRLLLLLSLAACLPAPAPIPTGAGVDPPVASPPFPVDDTLLNVIPAADWPDLCDEHAAARDLLLLTCNDIPLEFEARTQQQAAAECLDFFRYTSTWAGCTATFADFLATVNREPTCETPPEPVVRVFECSTTAPPPPTCASVFDPRPFMDEPGVFSGVTLSWVFSAMDPSITFELRDAVNNPIHGAGEWVGSAYLWTPAGPLSPSSTYSSTLTWCDGVSSLASSFSTSSVGAPVPTAGLAGRTYSVELASGVLLRPAGAAGLAPLAFVDSGLLVSVSSADAGSVEVIVAQTQFGAQDLCAPTHTSPIGSFSGNPFFELGPMTLPMNAAGVSAVLTAGVVSGAFAASGNSIELQIAGEADTRDLLEQVAPGGSDNELCDTLIALGVACEACPDGSGPFCLTLEIADLVGEEVFESVVPRTSFDVASDSFCP